MKPKQLILVVVLALVLGGLAVVVNRRNQAAYQTSGAGQGQKVLPGFPLNDVARILIRGGTNELALVKDQDSWKVRERANYPAGFVEVGDFLREVWDLKAVQTDQVGPSVMGRFQLLEPSAATNTAVRVDFQDAAGKAVATLYLGKKHMRKGESASPMGGGDEGFPDGRYVMTAAKVGQVALVSKTFAEIEPKPDRWLSKDFFKVEKLKSVEVTHKAVTNSWRLYREIENGELKLAEPQAAEKFDTGKASPAGNALSYPSFVDVMAGDAKADETGLAEPITAKVETFEGFNYVIQLAKKPGSEENYSLKVAVAADIPKEREPGKDEKPEDKERLDKEFKAKTEKLQEKLKAEKACEPWVYVVSKWTVDPILKERRELMQDNKPEAKVGDAAVGAPPAMLAEPADDDDKEEPADAGK